MNLGLKAPLENCPTRIDTRRAVPVSRKAIKPVAYYAHKVDICVTGFRNKAKEILGVSSSDVITDEEFELVVRIILEQRRQLKSQAKAQPRQPRQ